MSENEKPRDGLGALLGALGVSNGMNCRTIRNSDTGAVGFLPNTMTDVDEWERQCIAMHDAQKLAYAQFLQDDQPALPTRLIRG